MARRRFEDPGREASIRPDRIASLLAQIVQERILRGFADPRIRGMVSITKVDVSTDLRSAMIQISVLPDLYGPRTISGLRSVAGMLRRTIRDQTSMRRVPDLQFRLDDSLKHAASLDEAIRDRPNTVKNSSPSPFFDDEEPVAPDVSDVGASEKETTPSPDPAGEADENREPSEERS